MQENLTQINKYVKSQSIFSKETLKFYLWGNAYTSTKYIKGIYNLQDFCNKVRSRDVYKEDQGDLWIINNTDDKGKEQINFVNVPRVVFVDIDFHSKDDSENEAEINKFLSDTNTQSLNDFISKLKKDKYALTGGLSKSGKGIRIIFLVHSKYSIIEETSNFEDKPINFTLDEIKKIHKSNWEFVMNYLSEEYNLDLNSSYSHDKCPSNIQQGTKYFREAGSFVNINCDWMYNDFKFKEDEAKEDFNRPVKNTEYSEESLRELYKNNKNIFAEAFKSWEPYFKLLTYVLPYQKPLIYDFFYEIVNKHYASNSFKHAHNKEKFKEYFKTLPNGKTSYSLDAFFRTIGIPIKFEFEDLVIEEQDEELDPARKTPMIDDFVYENLPSIFKRTCNELDNRREKDVLLLSTLTVLSSIFPNVYSINDGDPIYCNLLTFIIAKSASGKGKLKYARYLIQRIIDTEEHFLISGDISSSSLVQELCEGGGVGVMIEAEADTISKNFNEGWAKGLSSTLRDAFDNNLINQSRVGKNGSHREKYKIEKTRLSVLVSGTKNQYFNFMNNGKEDGLFSRFLHYVFSQETIVRNTYLSAVKGNVGNRKQNFEINYGTEVFELFEYYKKFDDIFIYLSEEQANKAFENNRKNMQYIKSFYFDEDVDSIVLRLGVMLHKISMILTIVRNYENRDLYEDHTNNMTETEIKCSDIDLDIAISIVNTLLHHAKVIFSSFPIDDKHPRIFLKANDTERLYYDLPDKFETKDVYRIATAKYSKFSNSKVDKVLRNWLKNKRIDKEKKGIYIKLEK